MKIEEMIALVPGERVLLLKNGCLVPAIVTPKSDPRYLSFQTNDGMYHMYTFVKETAAVLKHWRYVFDDSFRVMPCERA